MNQDFTIKEDLNLTILSSETMKVLRSSNKKLSMI